MSVSNSSALRAALREAYRADETQIVEAFDRQGALHAGASSSEFSSGRAPLVQIIRDKRQKTSGIDAFLNTYDLSSREGVVLMCMAEALLRIPDTRDGRPD
jgi:RHH-type proline utilization regulon transcriptional repressor/proline dehydrogenase/delta 1-pyrroline-5-carboxylate dehydrogenase